MQFLDIFVCIQAFNRFVQAEIDRLVEIQRVVEDPGLAAQFAHFLPLAETATIISARGTHRY